MFITKIEDEKEYMKKLIGFDVSIARKLMEHYPEVMRKDSFIYFLETKEIIEMAKKIEKELK